VLQQITLHFDHVNDKPSFSIHYLTGACHSTPLLSQLHIPINSLKSKASSSSSSITKQQQQQQQQQHVRFDTWSLDCSPDCRADPNAICEHERFDLDSVAFINEAYDSSNNQHHRLEEGGTGTETGDVVCENESSDNKDTMTCKIEQQQQQPQQHPPPDYLVTTSSYVNRIGLDLLHSHGLNKLDQFPQRMQGIRLAGRYTLFDEPGNSFSPSSHSIYTLKLPLGQNQYITLLEVSVEDMVVFHHTKQQTVAT
jgi:hypothetical protein